MKEISAKPQEQIILSGDNQDLYFTDGCCLKCSKSYVGCVCYKCKCRACLWYKVSSSVSKGGNCTYTGEHSKIEEEH